MENAFTPTSNIESCVEVDARHQLFKIANRETLLSFKDVIKCRSYDEPADKPGYWFLKAKLELNNHEDIDIVVDEYAMKPGTRDYHDARHKQERIVAIFNEICRENGKH